jgi:uncharacterized protein (TIGR02284 family)
MAVDHDIATLNSLTTTTIDSCDGYERAAAEASAGRFREMFRDLARDRRAALGHLQETARALGGTPSDDGSLAASVHRRWLDLREALTGGGDKAIVAEVERGEDHIKSKFEDALDDGDLSPTALEAIATAYQSVRMGHDRISDVKHAMEGNFAS